MLFNSKNTYLNFVDGVGFLQFPSLSELNFVNHAFSTRIGGVSEGAYKSMNLNYKRGDDPEKVTENYRIFCNAAGFDFDSLVSSSQDHNTFVRKVTRAAPLLFASFPVAGKIGPVRPSQHCSPSAKRQTECPACRCRRQDFTVSIPVEALRRGIGASSQLMAFVSRPIRNRCSLATK